MEENIYIPNVVHTALLQGDWLAGHVQVGTVTVLLSKEELKNMQDTKMQNQISILRCPKFWKFDNSRSNSLEGDVRYEKNGIICTRMNVKSARRKM